jgi:murein hydrolase activator
MLIIDHGDHYYTVYAHLEEVFKIKGDRVEKDEVIATVGDSGSLMGPGLHFEVRHHGKPMDPLQWIKKDRRFFMRSRNMLPAGP